MKKRKRASSLPRRRHQGSAKVVSRRWTDHSKVLTLTGGRRLSVPRSACVTRGDTIKIHPNEGAEVVCRNGRAKISPAFSTKRTLRLGGRRIPIRVKEITSTTEFSAYEHLAALHYRNQGKHGRTAVLVVTATEPQFPRVLGYIELASPFYVSKPRARFFDTPFAHDDVKWTRWNSLTTRKYLGLFVRISRCVVAPEFRGLGLGTILLRSAAQFARDRWHHSGFKPLFLEISADMLRFVPFTQRAGFTYIGDTEGNLARVAKDIDYLTRNAARVRSKEIVREDSFGIVDQQVSRMRNALRIMRDHRLTRGELVAKLKNLNRNKVLKDFALFVDVVSLPKPTFIYGLTETAQRFVKVRSQDLGCGSPRLDEMRPQIKSLARPIRLRNVAASFSARVRRNSHTHAIQQAFGISPDSLVVDVLRGITFSVQPGSIVVITGPSGAGKSVLMDVIAGTQRHGLTLCGSIWRPSNMRAGYLTPLNSNKSLIEIFGQPDVEAGIKILSQMGISDAFLYLRRFPELSAGQQYRVMLADLVRRNCNLALIDEFCSTLDPVTASTVAASLAKLVRTTGLTAVLAAPHTSNFLSALRPDRLVSLSSYGSATIRPKDDVVLRGGLANHP